MRPVIQAKVDGFNRRAGQAVVAVDFVDNPDYDPAGADDDTEKLCRWVAQVSLVDAGSYRERRLLGAWDFSGDGEPLRFGEVTEAPDPKLCDHCGTRRNRRMVFVFEDGIHVGSACMRDISGRTVATMLRLADWVRGLDDDLAGDIWESSLTGSKPSLTDTRLFVAAALHAIRETGGYVPASETDAEPTKTAAIGIYAALFDPLRRSWLTDDLLVSAGTALAWAAELDADSDFDRNLRAVGTSSEIGKRALGFAAFLPEAHRRALAKKEQRNADRERRKIDVPEGRHTVTGTVMSVKWQDSLYGATRKMLVRCDGFDVWGTAPRSADIDPGDTITFTATLERSADTGFGFFKRPTKTTVAAA